MNSTQTTKIFQLWDTLLVLSIVYVVFLILPTIPFYKNLEDKLNTSSGAEVSDATTDKNIHQHPPYTICQ